MRQPFPPRAANGCAAAAKGPLSIDLSLYFAVTQGAFLPFTFFVFPRVSAKQNTIPYFNSYYTIYLLILPEKKSKAFHFSLIFYSGKSEKNPLFRPLFRNKTGRGN
ncbi:MAG: hypothetical protein K6B40_01725 [Firmicutes bacterium]|nr:hypothetical protein [Bacillota bacterium]